MGIKIHLRSSGSLPKETALGRRTQERFSKHKEGQVACCSLVGGRNPNSQPQCELRAGGSGREGSKVCGAWVMNRLAILKVMGTEQERFKQPMHNTYTLYGAPSDSSL